MSFWSKIKTMLFIAIVSISCKYVYVLFIELAFLQEKVHFFEISKQMRTNVFHQHQAVELILENMQRMKDKQWQTEMFVMPFVGTSGVSKTHVANIIKQNYHPSYVHDIKKNDLLTNFDQTYFDVLKDLQGCCNLIIVDDLTSVDIDLVNRFITDLPKSKVVLVIPIINIQNINVVNNELKFSVNEKCLENMEKKFKSARLNFQNVFFDELSKSDLETAIIQLMLERDVDYAKCGHLIKEIVDNHDVVTHGYKHLHNKLNVIWDCGYKNMYNVNIRQKN